MPRVIIDTDPGIDDAQAILFALLSREFEVSAVTTVFGNVPVDVATRNALHLLGLAKHDTIPVFQGAAEPLLRRRAHFAPHVHGSDGFGGAPVGPLRLEAANGYAADEIARRVTGAPGEITVLALGPLTNVALAIRLDPRVPAAVREIVFMGGVIKRFGNVTPVAVANTYNDVEAAAVVLRSGARITMIGQDVTQTARHSSKLRTSLHHSECLLSEFLFQATTFYESYYQKTDPGDGFPVHDLLVAVYAARPSWFRSSMVALDVETAGELTTGMTVADLRPWSEAAPNVNVCWEVDAAKLFAWYEEVIRVGCDHQPPQA